jgi:hypothetical protein
MIHLILLYHLIGRTTYTTWIQKIRSHQIHFDPEDPAVPFPLNPDDPEVPLPDVPDDPDLPTDIVVCIFELLFEPSKYVVTKTELP